MNSIVEQLNKELNEIKVVDVQHHHLIIDKSTCTLYYYMYIHNELYIHVYVHVYMNAIIFTYFVYISFSPRGMSFRTEPEVCRPT